MCEGDVHDAGWQKGAVTCGQRVRKRGCELDTDVGGPSVGGCEVVCCGYAGSSRLEDILSMAVLGSHFELWPPDLPRRPRWNTCLHCHAWSLLLFQVVCHLCPENTGNFGPHCFLAFR